jgi:hypothetical protein
MRIERVRRWQWILLGLVLGLVVGFVKLWGGSVEPDHSQGTQLHVFEDQLIRAVDPSRKTPVQVGQIILHPKSEVIVPGSRQPEMHEVITYWVWFPAKVNDKKEVVARPEARSVALYEDPSQKSVLGDISKFSGREYLDKLKNHIQKLDKSKFKFAQNFEYRYAWLETPRGAYTAYGVGGIVMVGLIWPTIVHLLVGAGYGRPVEEDDEYLSRFKGTSAPQAKPMKVGMTEADLAELERMEARLEAQLKDAGLEMTPVAAGAKSNETAAQAAEKAARKFSGAAAEEIKKQEPAHAGAHKEFGADQGDYYPTEVHGKHKS